MASNETRTAAVRMHPLGFVHQISKPGVHETREDAVENVKLIVELLKDNRRGLLVDVRSLLGQDKACLDYYRGAASAGYALAVALVINSRFEALMVSMLLSFRSKTAMRLFTDEKSAITWLIAQLPRAREAATKAQDRAAGLGGHVKTGK